MKEAIFLILMLLLFCGPSFIMFMIMSRYDNKPFSNETMRVRATIGCEGKTVSFIRDYPTKDLNTIQKFIEICMVGPWVKKIHKPISVISLEEVK
jgi:hypothetical protein